ncbi:GNAT family acetyltransferase acetyltransferase [Fusarium heterosporum]|uniref:GNAT family acetyltransferase acetyltransferase n=1 Tax=Fusarium heterosporum TaxID=42747 RepID=A0A8H5T105_FUSHE|nr:GNAT family acetyltransferase acetyltransferase [Fusarium heterosporum]
MDAESFANAYSSKRLVYRGIENNDKDIEYLFKHHETDPVNTVLAGPSLLRPRNRKAAEAFLTDLQKCSFSVMICLSPSEAKAQNIESCDPVPIGFALLGWGGTPAGHEHHRNTSLGINLSGPFNNKGYGSEAINWVLDWAFRFGGYHRVALGTYEFNKRAQHVYTKLGFREEGREREALYLDRKWYDVINYGMLESEWAALRGLE